MIYGLLVFTNLILVTCLIIVTRRSLILTEKLDEISTQVEESLDIIDDCYKDVSRHLNSPVLFDDPVVIMMINDVKTARDSMLLIANKLTEPFSYEESGSDEEEKSDR